MRSRFLLPVLLLLALAGYLWPEQATTAFSPTPPAPSNSLPHSPPAQLPGELPAEALKVFNQSRRAVVRIESADMVHGTGGLGTGFFISEGGQVLTAYHVVSDATLFRIQTLSGQYFSAKMVAFDDASDAALLQVDTKAKLPFLPLSARKPQVGETVLAIGNSGGDFLQPRLGQLLRLDVAAAQADFPSGTLEMNAPLAPGDSGGPILNAAGQVMGIVSYVRVDGNNQTRASYAVPVSQDSPLLRSLIAGEQRDVAVIGIAIDSQHSGQTKPAGAVIYRVAKGGPAEAAGLRGASLSETGEVVALGDIITKVDGQATPDPNSLMSVVRSKRIGERVTVNYFRDGTERQVTLTLVGKRTLEDLR